MRQKSTRYLSYLLRIWQTRSGDELIWRASLDSPDTHQHYGFGSLQALVTFLEAETGEEFFPRDVEIEKM